MKRAEEETGEADLGEVYICKWSKLKTAVDASELNSYTSAGIELGRLSNRYGVASHALVQVAFYSPH